VCVAAVEREVEVDVCLFREPADGVQTLGLIIPQTLLATADEVIQ
jgi:hypothetical protein